MLRSLVLLTALSSPTWAQTSIGPTAVPLGAYVDLDQNNNVTGYYSSPQNPQDHPATTWLPIADPRVQAFFSAHVVLNAVTPTGVPQK